MKDSEVTEMMTNLKKKQGKPSKPSEEALDAAYIRGYDFGYQWVSDIRGLWVYDKEVDEFDDEWRLATSEEKKILQYASILVALRNGQNEKETKKRDDYLKGLNK